MGLAMEGLIMSKCITLLQVFFMTLPRLGAGMFDCSSECFLPYQDGQSVDSCDTVITVLDCYSSNQAACDDDFDLYFVILQASQDYASLGCGDDNVTPTVLTSSPPPVSMAQPTGMAPQPMDTAAPLPTGTDIDVAPQPMSTAPQPMDTAAPLPTGTDVAPQPMSTAPQPTLQPSTTCPTLSDEAISSVSSMSSAVLFPEPHPAPECTSPRVSHLRQCSLFMDSQLRAFDSYRVGLEACSLSGSWYLFHHQKLTIEVEAASLETGSNHTRLTKVNVTFHAHECNPTIRTYTAFNSATFPSDFTPSQLGASTSSLRVLFGADGSVVTLMDTWLNATIVIRKYMEFLSVTLQVPREVSQESEGLCTGCPPHMYINITSFNELYPTLCPDENTKVLLSCFDHGGVANEAGLLHIQNNSYLDACIYSLFKIGRILDVLTMFNAIANDAKLLVNVGAEPRTPQTVNIPVDPITFPLSSSPTDIAQSATITTNSASAFHNSRLPLTLLAISHGILIAR